MAELKLSTSLLPAAWIQQRDAVMSWFSSATYSVSESSGIEAVPEE